MTRPAVTLERVIDLIAAYGAEPAEWPEAERAEAEALLESHPDAFAEALAEAKHLDDMLAREHIETPGDALVERILSSAPQASAQAGEVSSKRRLPMFPKTVRWPGGAVLASLAMGIAGGYAYAATGGEAYSVESTYQTAFGYDGYSDWFVEDAAP